MPIYCFAIPETGESVELFMSVAEVMRRKRKNNRWKLPDGRMAIRDKAAEFGGQKSGEHRGYPYLCEASGVMPKQVDKAREESVANGCPTDFTRDGRAIIRDSSHRRKYFKSIGLHDNNSFF